MFIIWVLIGLVLVVVFVLMGGLGMLVGTSVDVGKDYALATQRAMTAYQECLVQAGPAISRDDQLRVGRRCAGKLKQEYAKIEEPKLREAMVRSVDLTVRHQECMHRGMQAEEMAFEDALRRGIQPTDPTQGMTDVQRRCQKELERELAEVKRSLAAE